MDREFDTIKQLLEGCPLPDGTDREQTIKRFLEDYRYSRHTDIGVTKWLFNQDIGYYASRTLVCQQISKGDLAFLKIVLEYPDLTDHDLMGYLTPTRFVETSEGPNHRERIHEAKYRMRFASFEILDAVLEARPEFVEYVKQTWRELTVDTKDLREPVWIRVKKEKKDVVDRLAEVGLGFLILPDCWTEENLPESVKRDPLFEIHTASIIDRYRVGIFEPPLCSRLDIKSIFNSRALVPVENRHKERWDRLFLEEVYNFADKYSCSPKTEAYLQGVVIDRKKLPKYSETLRKMPEREREIFDLASSYGREADSTHLSIVQRLATEEQYELMAYTIVEMKKYELFEWAFTHENPAIKGWTSYIKDHEVFIRGGDKAAKMLELFHKFQSLHKVYPLYIAQLDRDGLLEKYKEGLHLGEFLETQIASRFYDQGIIPMLQVLPDVVPDADYLETFVASMDYGYDDHVSFRERAEFYGYYKDQDGKIIIRLRPQYRKFFVELIAKLPENEQLRFDWFISSTD